MNLVVLPLLALNLLAGAAGGIWLAVEKQWMPVAYGTAITVAGLFIAPLLLMPGILLSGPAVSASNRRNYLMVAVLGGLSLLYGYVVMGAWAIYAYHLFVGDTWQPTAAVLWAYGTATVAWSFLAFRQADSNKYGVLSSVFHVVGCIVLAVYCHAHFRLLDWMTMAFLYAVPILVGIGVQLFLAMAGNRRSSIF